MSHPLVIMKWKLGLYPCRAPAKCVIDISRGYENVKRSNLHISWQLQFHSYSPYRLSVRQCGSISVNMSDKFQTYSPQADNVLLNWNLFLLKLPLSYFASFVMLCYQCSSLFCLLIICPRLDSTFSRARILPFLCIFCSLTLCLSAFPALPGLALTDGWDKNMARMDVSWAWQMHHLLVRCVHLLRHTCTIHWHM